MATIKSHIFYLLGYFFLGMALTSCAQDNSSFYPSYKNYIVQPYALNSPHNLVLLNTYSYQQTTNYTCGPAVVMSLMHYYGKLSTAEMNSTTELRIAKEMGTTQWGTMQDKMVGWLENHGFSVQYGQRISLDMLLNNLKHRVPVIMVWNDWSGHSMLAIGYYKDDATDNSDKDVIFFADPSTSSYIVNNQKSIYGINTVTPKQLNLMWLNAQYFFNPTHTAVGMYIIAVPK